ncbi:MAG: PKD domain-containing protein [Bacteroidia bacterium]|nr:PKD domain-containing protein [Bacteroidia bacterium]
MRKYCSLILFALILYATPRLMAGGGPDAYGYIWKASIDVGGPTYSWVNIASTGTLVTGLGDDNSAGPVNIGFPFHYYWSDYTQLKVGSNGWLGFDNIGNLASCFPPIPQQGGAGDNYIAPFMSDLNFAGTGNPGTVRYWTNNVDSFVISYLAVPFWDVNTGFSGSNTFQVILNGQDSSITFQYNVMNSTFTNSTCTTDVVVGIENSTGSIGLNPYLESIPPNSFAVKFYYPNPVLIAVKDISPIENNNPGNQAIFVQAGGFNLNSRIKNVGNTAVTSAIAISGKLKNLGLTQVYTSSANLTGLAAGADTLINFSPTVTISTAGEYYWEVTSTNANDINTANDINSTEVQVVDLTVSTATLDYVSGNTSSGTAISWSGGQTSDGAGIYIEPPVYPVTITQLRYFIASATVGYTAILVDDNGPGGSPGTQLANVPVAQTSITTNAWNVVTLASPVTITSGGFYVGWLMGGTGVTLGAENTGPLSNRGYEILSGIWGEYRSNSTQDIMIGAVITNYPCLPTASFNTSVSGATATFTNTATGGLSTLWDFGDGNTSTSTSPSHTYTASGSYTVCLSSTNSCGTDSVCQTVNICLPMTANFTSSVSSLTASFTDMTSPAAVSWQWDFGDGNTSTQQNPSHTYATSGSYTVCLIANTTCSADTVCKTVFLCQVPTAGFTSGVTSLVGSFSDQSQFATSWLWQFGDGQTSTLQNPTHQYNTVGSYNVCLIASNSCASDTFCDSILLCTSVVSGFNWTNSNMVYNFTDNSSGTPVAWHWNFGDGGTSTQQNPTHTFANAGSFNVCLTTYNACGDSNLLCNSVSVLVGITPDLWSGTMEVFPNPARDLIHLTATHVQEKELTVRLISPLGSLVLERKISVSGGQANLDIPLDGLASGMYSILLQGDSGTISRKILKE